MSALHHYPPNIGDVRRRLFCLDEPVALSAADFQAYWPHVDNFWSTTSTVRIEDGRRMEYFRCRLHPKGDWKPAGGGKQLWERQKPSWTAISCPQTMRVVHNAGTVTVEPLTGKFLHLPLHILIFLLGSEHTHTLDDSDRFKRPSVFRDLAARGGGQWLLCGRGVLKCPCNAPSGGSEGSLRC